MQPDDVYVEIFLAPLRLCASYRPAFGRSGSGGTSLDAFRTLYGSDPLYHWLGLDSDLMYAAHKAAGGMTSIYRQLGIGCERFFRQIAQDALGLDDHQVTWAYEVESEDGQQATLTLDARIDLNHVAHQSSRDRLYSWMQRASRELGVDMAARQLHGAIFEVRQGYKSADSKRQNADLRSGVQRIH
jgi:hypothetical protein